MKRYVKANSELLYFAQYQIDNIGEWVADNLTHKYRSEGADFHYDFGQQAYDYKTGKYRVTISCRVFSHYDPEINENARYGAYLDTMDGKTFEATYYFGYNRYDTQDTMGKQVIIGITDDIENQIFTAVNGKVDACTDIKASTDISDDKVKFFYKGKFLGSCDPDYMECDALYDLLKSDKEAATQVLNYMNSLGDAVFPVSEEDYTTPETDVSKVNIRELYNIFMQELGYCYDDWNGDLYVGGDAEMPDFEIYAEAWAEGVDLNACDDIKR